MITPRFKFETREVAESLKGKILHAKADYDEAFFALNFYNDEDN